MTRAILYFPYIEIKDSVWLRNAILYWDRICSIVPHESYRTTSWVIDYLCQNGIYHPIYPQKLFDSYLYQDFSREFIDSLKSYDNTPKQRSGRKTDATSGEAFHYTNIHVAKLLPELTSNLHYKKIPYELYEYMQKFQILQSTEDKEWVKVEAKAAELYMSILAKYLAEIDNTCHMVIGTDAKRHIKSAFPKTFDGKSAVSKNLCFTVALENALPVPNPDIPLEDIIRFKQQRQQELLQVREKLRDFENQISNCESMNQVRGIICDFRESWQKELIELDKMMKDNRITYFMGCMQSLVTASIPGITTAISTYMGGHIPSWIALASFGVAGSIGLGVKGVKYRKEQYQTQQKSDFLYLYQAKKHGIIKICPETMIV